ncbi:glycoside hydrolase family 2 protein [Teratosphaeria destructans]|uniref:Glycoside hydrolase family 2 protein n=1 Tax=Teratosphaeria destructans TaxID=418781 RepID=A0A9W7VY90_9PEZI|nr:glycoside hydrolase family 2 protein [Teratosphaeria destructans]
MAVPLLTAATLICAATAIETRRQSANASTIPYAVKPPPLTTNWTYEVGTNPWPQYPRPQLQREQWQTLNGIWTYQNASSLDAVNDPPFNQSLTNEVLIPSCLESSLSGIMTEYNLYSWFATHFSVPSSWPTDNKVLLNFGAIDYEATIFINGKNATFHRGGYFAFAVDVTPYLNHGSTNELLVFVHDPTDSDPYVIPIGKQTLRPSHIFYTPCSGIWQSVWIESAPATYISDLQISGGMDGVLNATVMSDGSGRASVVSVSVIDRESNRTIAKASGTVGSSICLSVPGVKLWSPDSPTLYDLQVTLGMDVVKSYTGFRTISKGTVNGIERPLLNGEFEFIFGTLDQGFWPDGIYTPPTLEAAIYDIQTLKNLGFNALRKHIKVETALYYQACDELGIMVIQDMPSPRPIQRRTLPDCSRETILPDPTQQAEFQRQLERLVLQQRNFPSIIAWVIYNEGWGQITTYYPEFALVDLVRTLDPTRLIDATTGWYDHGAGDFSDNHHYANPQCGAPFYSTDSSPYDPRRIGLQGEFGGIGNNVSIEHLWPLQPAFDNINATYELDIGLAAWNFRAHRLLDELREQISLFACSGGIWTQTTDVEGEVNGLLTYDRRILRPDVGQWRRDIRALYEAAAKRGNGTLRDAGWSEWWEEEWRPNGFVDGVPVGRI